MCIRDSADTTDGLTHIGQQLHGVRSCSELNQGAIDIEEQRAGIVQQWRWRTQGERFSHDAQPASVGVYVGSRAGDDSASALSAGCRHEGAVPERGSADPWSAPPQTRVSRGQNV